MTSRRWAAATLESKDSEDSQRITDCVSNSEVGAYPVGTSEISEELS